MTSSTFIIARKSARLLWCKGKSVAIELRRHFGNHSISRTSPMKLLLAHGMLLAGIVPAAAAETWICTFPGLISPMTVIERFEVRAAEVVREGQTTYRIVENNARGLTATYAHTPSPD